MKARPNGPSNRSLKMGTPTAASASCWACASSACSFSATPAPGRGRAGRLPGPPRAVARGPRTTRGRRRARRRRAGSTRDAAQQQLLSELSEAVRAKLLGTLATCTAALTRLERTVETRSACIQGPGPPSMTGRPASQASASLSRRTSLPRDRIEPNRHCSLCVMRDVPCGERIDSE